MPFSDRQIREIVKSILPVDSAKYLTEDPLEERIEHAKLHISAAVRIVGDLESSLADRAAELDRLSLVVEQRKKEVSHYQVLSEAKKRRG